MVLDNEVSVPSVFQLLDGWTCRHAEKDCLPRNASEVLENPAQASRLDVFQDICTRDDFCGSGWGVLPLNSGVVF